MITIFLAIGLIIIFVILAGLAIYFQLKNRNKLTIPEKKFLREQWQIILDLSKNSPQKAILEADKILDLTLKKSGAIGESIPERINFFADKFQNIDLVFTAHKLRNRLAHEIGYNPAENILYENLGYFEQALVDLEVFQN